MFYWWMISYEELTWQNWNEQWWTTMLSVRWRYDVLCSLETMWSWRFSESHKQHNYKPEGLLWESCNLALNPSKTNWMIISTPQMARYRTVEERKLSNACGNTPLKRISYTKLLGVYMDQHLTWKTYVDHVLSSSRDSVQTAQVKNLSPFMRGNA